MFPKRPSFLFIILLVMNVFLPLSSAFGKKYAITIDDPHLYRRPALQSRHKLTPNQRNHRILKHLQKAGKKAVLFVCGKRVKSPGGKALLQSWVKQGHSLANHSWSHLYFHSRRVSLQRYQRDLLRNQRFLEGFGNVLKLFRFPYLKEGNTLHKRDGMRHFLRARGLRNGYVTIDASDWYIDQRLRRLLQTRAKVPYNKIRKYYLHHIWNRARYYEGLAQKLGYRNLKHTLLLHHNHLNALFLGDLIRFLKTKGWSLLDADKVYKTQPLQNLPKTLPAGESILWSWAKQKGLKGLRYPAEDSRYEKANLDRLLSGK